MVKASALSLIAAVTFPSNPRDDPRGADVISPAASSRPAKGLADERGRSLPMSGPGALEAASSAGRPSPQAPGAAATSTAPAPPRVLETSTGLEVEKGDKLKLGFYETIDLESEPDGGGSREPLGALRTFYERADVSGEYTVEENGVLSVPLLGQVRAAGRDIEDIRNELATSFASVIGRNARVEAKIVERAPIYVVGPVRAPGPVRYAPGIFVLQAVALAGGFERGGDSRGALIEGARELERLRVSTLQIGRLTARRARLEAQRREAASPNEFAVSIGSSGPHDIVAYAPPPLEGAFAASRAVSFAAMEGDILREEQAKRRQRDTDLAERVDAARETIEAIKAKLDQFAIERALRAERLEAMQKLRDRGIDTNDHVLALRTELADIEARRQDCRVALVDAEARLTQALEERKRASLEYASDLVKEIAAVDKEMTEVREAAGASEFVTAVLSRFVAPGAQPRYEIVRVTRAGASRMPASETSLLMPGDVLEVE